jgi:ubiquinone biosynthesis protein
MSTPGTLAHTHEDRPEQLSAAQAWGHKAAFLWHHATVLVWVLAQISVSYGWLLFLLRVLEVEVDPARISAAHQRNARRYRLAAEQLKGATIKIGQILSTRVDLTPPECVAELRQLQDSVEPEPYPYVAAQLQAAFGQPPEVLFARFDRAALAAASFGQVHRARTHEGHEVAVKVLHAHIHESLAIDLFCFSILVQLFGPLFPQLHMTQINEEMNHALRAELRYDLERESSERVRANFADDPRIVIPATFPALCTPTVITTAFLEGFKINDFAALERHHLLPSEVLRLLADAYIRQIYVHGFFQSDPHPGNLFVLPPRSPQNDTDALRLGIIDFGQSKEISPQVQENLRRAVLGVVLKDEALFLEGLLAMGGPLRPGFPPRPPPPLRRGGRRLLQRLL